jgi:ferredoxin
LLSACGDQKLNIALFDDFSYESISWCTEKIKICGVVRREFIFMPVLTVKTDKKKITVEHDAALIDICENHETSILFGCRDGACGACLVRILENPQNLSPIQESEQDFLETMAARPDERLACQCRIFGDVTLEVSE